MHNKFPIKFTFLYFRFVLPFVTTCFSIRYKNYFYTFSFDPIFTPQFSLFEYLSVKKSLPNC